jgi:hypothetical protein
MQKHFKEGVNNKTLAYEMKKIEKQLIIEKMVLDLNIKPLTMHPSNQNHQDRSKDLSQVKMDKINH